MGAMLCCALSWIRGMNGVFEASRGLFVTGRHARGCLHMCLICELFASIVSCCLLVRCCLQVQVRLASCRLHSLHGDRLHLF